MTYTRKPSAIYWVIGVIALLWNGMGVAAYLARAYATDEMIATLPPEQQAEFLVEYPAWYTAAFALAVFCGALGAIMLLFKKKLAYPLFVISAVAAIAQHTYLFMNVEIPSMIMPILIILVCLFLIWHAKKSIDDGILT